MSSATSKANIMIAFDQGKPIQRNLNSRIEPSWVDDSNPLWNWAEFSYRVRPEPREFWLYDDQIFYDSIDAIHAANDDGLDASYVIHVIEKV